MTAAVAPSRTYPIHPVTRLFPPMTDSEYTELRDDIEWQNRFAESNIREGVSVDTILQFAEYCERQVMP